MAYETLGKLTLTILILLLIPIVYIIGCFIYVVVEDLTDKFPQWVKTTIALTLLGLIIIFMGVLIYNAL